MSSSGRPARLRNMPEHSRQTAIPIESQPRPESCPKQYPKGRRCNNCKKLLSIWNAGPSCYTCEEKLTDIRTSRPLMLDREFQPF